MEAEIHPQIKRAKTHSLGEIYIRGFSWESLNERDGPKENDEGDKKTGLGGSARGVARVRKAMERTARFEPSAWHLQEALKEFQSPRPGHLYQ